MVVQIQFFHTITSAGGGGGGSGASPGTPTAVGEDGRFRWMLEVEEANAPSNQQEVQVVIHLQ